MSNLAILGTIEFIAGAREQVLAALTAHRARSLADEPGTLQFEILVCHDQAATVTPTRSHRRWRIPGTPVRALVRTRQPGRSEIITTLVQVA